MKDAQKYAKKSGMDPLLAGAFTLAGLAVGTAATLYLSKKENRDKAQEKITELTDKAKDTFATIKTKSQKQADEMRSKANSLIA